MSRKKTIKIANMDFPTMENGDELSVSFAYNPSDGKIIVINNKVNKKKKGFVFR